MYLIIIPESNLGGSRRIWAQETINRSQLFGIQHPASRSHLKIHYRNENRIVLSLLKFEYDFRSW